MLHANDKGLELFGLREIPRELADAGNPSRIELIYFDWARRSGRCHEITMPPPRRLVDRLETLRVIFGDPGSRHHRRN